jgi:competence protein ComEA
VQLAILAAVATILFALAVRADERAPPPASVAAPSVAAGLVNLNQAGNDELERLPGIGPAKARAIVEHRHLHPFKKLDELTKVKGIGRRTFGKLRPYITLSGPTTLKSEPSRK